MKKIAIFALAAGLSFPVLAQDYTDYHSGADNSAAHANQSAYDQMMQRIDNKHAAEKPSNPTYLQGENAPVYDVGNYGNINGQRASASNAGSYRAPLGSRSGDVFVSQEEIDANKQRKRDLERGHDSNFQPVRE